MQTTLRTILLLGLLVWSYAPAQAQTVRVEAEASSTVVGSEEPLAYTIRVEGADFSSVETPEPPPTTGLVLRQATPNTQRNLSFSTGRLSRSIVFQWQYRPVREGTAEIQPATVVVQGRTYKTDAIEISVVPQSQRPTYSGTMPHGTAPAYRRDDDSEGPEETQIDEDDIFIRAQPASDRIFQNEQVTIEYQLFFRPGIQLRHSRLASAWDATGFWREELDVASRPIPEDQLVNGETYRTILLKRVAVFPTRSGTLQIDPLQIETEAHIPARNTRRSGRYFSLNSTYEPVTLGSDPLSVRVDPLPAGAPPAFDGAVGAFTLDTDVNTQGVRVGETIRLRIDIKGTGNIATMQPPRFEVPSAFEVYDPKVETDIDRSGERVEGVKTFTYVIVPRKNGTYTLPQVEFAYFDPDRGQYRTLQSEPLSVTVTGEEIPLAVGKTGAGLPVSDIAAIVSTPAQWVAAEAVPLYQRPWVYAALFVPLLIAGGLVAYSRRASDTENAVQSQEQQAVEMHLNLARRYRNQDNPVACFEALERAVVGFIGARLGISAAGLTRTRLDERMREYGISEQDRRDLYQLLDASDQARYSPERPSVDLMDAAIKRAKRLIGVFDQALPAARSYESGLASQ